MTFSEAYDALNDAQKKAVDTTEGPVMVIAGPGTGKTHILTLRIANILRKSDVGPSGILALTFTESATRTMRRRLAQLIGEKTAREITISTFHGFADMVMNRYPEYFADIGERRLIGEAESTLLWRDVLDAGDWRKLKPVKDQYRSIRHLSGLYDTHVREGYIPEQYEAWIRDEVDRITADEGSYASRGKTKGELKQDVKRTLQGYEKAFEAAQAMQAYGELKEKRGVYDFTDILYTVVSRLDEEPDLLASLQETYQYILADEHQDANGLQHRLMERIMSFHENPNLFVVGDDKQAIYRFQGADPAHFRAFKDIYPQALIITLSDSYRSTQGILDASHGVIAETGDHAELSAFRGPSPVPPVSLLIAPDELAEREQVAHMIEELIASGVPPHEIAVISQKNRTCTLFHQALEARGVPALLAGSISLTDNPIMGYVFATLEAVCDPTNINAKKKALLAPWWKRQLPEYLRLLRESPWREWDERVRELAPDDMVVLDELTEAARTLEPVTFLSKVLVESGARSYILSHKEHLSVIPLMRTFITTVEELSLRDSASTFPEVLRAFMVAEEHNKSVIRLSITEREGMVSVLTAHKSKGMEFRYVFLVHTTERDWEKRSNTSELRSPFVKDHDVDDVRRVMYVALTRAKDRVVVSYPEVSSDGKELLPSLLIPPAEPVQSTLVTDIPILHSQRTGREILSTLARAYLTEDGLSPSALDMYLESPATFFAKYVLRISDPQNNAMVLGTAVHAGLAALTQGRTLESALEDARRVIDASRLPRDHVFNDLKDDAIQRLTAYAQDLQIPPNSEAEVSLRTVRTIGGIPVILQGKADRIEDKSVVVDYKTASSIYDRKEAYERQLIFYAHLLNESGYTARGARIEQVLKDSTKRTNVVVDDERIADLLACIDAVVGELITGAWREPEEVSEFDGLLSVLGV